MSNKRYSELNRGIRTNQKIKAHFPTPTEVDYNRGFIRRYFIQKSNDKSAPIYEINSDYYQYYRRNPIYTAVTLRWRISGPKETQYDNEGRIVDRSVSESNRIAIKIVSAEMPNLKLHLPNLLQFYK